MRYVDVKSQESVPMAKKPKDQPKSKKGFYIVVCILTIAVFGVLGMLFGPLSVFSPVTIASSSEMIKLKETDGRTNILLLGSDQRKTGPIQQSKLTDTILVASIGKLDHDVVLISVPRDLWVKTPGGIETKINAVYTYEDAPGIKSVIEQTLGTPIHYYAVINFEIFKDTIDTLGGIDVNVENSFIDTQYPVEGKEGASDSERFQTVSFTAGQQTMNGETALKYVRSRHGNNNEEGDFARSKRQQNVIMAIKQKALSAETVLNPVKLKGLYDTYATNVDTDIQFTDIQSFYLLSQKIQFDKVNSIVLDDRSMADKGGLLYSPADNSLYGGAYVLIPKSGDYSQIRAYVQEYLFGQK